MKVSHPMSCPPAVQEGDLRQIFEPFGPVESASIQKEGGLRPQSFGFVQCVAPRVACVTFCVEP